MQLALISLAIAGAVYGLHRLALYAESRGWIFYLTRPPRLRTLGLLEELVEPEIEYLVEEQSSEAIRGAADESGDGRRS